jgi:hypothetical protein
VLKLVELGKPNPTVGGDATYIIWGMKKLSGGFSEVINKIS